LEDETRGGNGAKKYENVKRVTGGGGCVENVRESCGIAQGYSEEVFKIAESSSGRGRGKDEGCEKGCPEKEKSARKRAEGGGGRKGKEMRKRTDRKSLTYNLKDCIRRYTLFRIYELITSWLEFVQILFIFFESTCRRRRDVNITYEAVKERAVLFSSLALIRPTAKRKGKTKIADFTV